MHILLAVSWLDPFVALLWWVVQGINLGVHNLGVSLILLALLIRIAFWGLNVKQFKAMLAMQRIAPRLKQLQAKYKDDQQRLQQETMALYRQAGVNPLAGCLPMVVQLPILYSVYWVVVLNTTLKGPKGVRLDMCEKHIPAWFASFPLHDQLHAMCFNQSPFLWIGSTISAHFPVAIATSLGKPDILLLALYAVSMYFSMRYASAPSTDEQQAQVQKMMAIFLPLMIGYMGWRAQWPSAMILYWFSYNALTMGQQIYMLRRYHQPLSVLDSEHVVTEDVGKKALPATDGKSAQAAANPKEPAATDGSGAAPAGARRRRRNKKKRKR